MIFFPESPVDGGNAVFRTVRLLKNPLKTGNFPQLGIFCHQMKFYRVEHDNLAVHDDVALEQCHFIGRKRGKVVKAVEKCAGKVFAVQRNGSIPVLPVQVFERAAGVQELHV